MNDKPVAWLCRWRDGETVVWAWTIEEARLAAREQAGPQQPVSARLATAAEQQRAGEVA